MGVTIRPFKAVRPKAEYASQVAELPYDVYNTEEARAVAGDNPYSFLRVDKPEIDLPQGTDPYSQQVYSKAAENLSYLMDTAMVQDEQPKLYIYRLTVDGRSQTGLAACVSVDEYKRGLIKRHEFTLASKEQDRIDHINACKAHTGPIFMAYRCEGDSDPVKIMADWLKQPATYDFTAKDGVRHELWVVSDAEVQESLIRAFEQIPCLYIADGHHRNASAMRVADMRNAGLEKTGDAEHDFYLAVIFPHNTLAIMDYNRVVTDLNGMTSDAFIETLKKDWTVEKSSIPVKPKRKFEVGMYLAGAWYRLTLNHVPDPNNVIKRLDCSVLQDVLLSPVLGINDPKTDKRIDFVGGIRGLKELQRRVDSGEMKVAFALYPTSMDELLDVADAGEIMPPKSTWFEPKLRSGLLVHLF